MGRLTDEMSVAASRRRFFGSNQVVRVPRGTNPDSAPAAAAGISGVQAGLQLLTGGLGYFADCEIRLPSTFILACTIFRSVLAVERKALAGRGFGD